MQIEQGQSACPACGAAGLQHFPVLHHMVCAYVGPQYDYVAAPAGYACPKCRREIVSDDQACEIVGTSARCVRCRKEMVMSPRSADCDGAEGTLKSISHVKTKLFRGSPERPLLAQSGRGETRSPPPESPKR